MIDAELKVRTKDQLPIDKLKVENPEYRLVALATLFEPLVSKQRNMELELIENDVHVSGSRLLISGLRSYGRL